MDASPNESSLFLGLFSGKKCTINAINKIQDISISYEYCKNQKAKVRKVIPFFCVLNFQFMEKEYTLIRIDCNVLI